VRKEIIIYGEPKPQQRARHFQSPKTGKIIIYSPKENNRDASKQLAVQKPRVPLSGPIKMSIWFFMPRPKTVTRKFHTVKPDSTNLERFFEDEMVKLHYIIDDSYICEKHIKKLYADDRPPVTIIHLEQLEPELF
jgi:Holliday junction resolvase RusA-like endonuclease